MENKDIIKNLSSTDQITVINTLEYISKNGNKSIFPHVINLLKSTNNNLIREEIIKILDHLKIQECAENIVDAINDKSYQSVLPILVSACWKNGLNFEKHIESFVDVFIMGDFQLAFDAFTVIDNFENTNTSEADKCLVKLNNFIEDTKNDKQTLLATLIQVIEDLKENPAS